MHQKQVYFSEAALAKKKTSETKTLQEESCLSIVDNRKQ